VVPTPRRTEVQLLVVPAARRVELEVSTGMLAEEAVPAAPERLGPAQAQVPRAPAEVEPPEAPADALTRESLEMASGAPVRVARKATRREKPAARA